jgi:hypothetical protein
MLKHALIQSVFNEICDELEMLARLFGNMALGVACVITGEAIAAAATGKRMKEIHALGEFAETQIEEAGATAIGQKDAEAGKRSQKLAERLKVEMAVDQKLRAAEVRR